MRQLNFYFLPYLNSLIIFLSTYYLYFKKIKIVSKKHYRINFSKKCNVLMIIIKEQVYQVFYRVKLFFD